MSRSESPDYSADDIKAVLKAGFINATQSDALADALEHPEALKKADVQKARVRLIEGLVVLLQEE
ncbi:hypothetical protein JW752_00435 [Candidatus Peregrinibacteria bacterium]|nr:hypothetical protein [Candidatus Peregrinibacteria bacterium]